MREPPDLSYVQTRLTEAGKTIIALPATGTRPGGVRSCMPDYIYEYMDIGNWTEIVLRTPKPTPAQIQRMDEVLQDWIPLITDHRDRRIVQMRILTNPVTEKPLFKWARIGRIFGIHRTHARATYERAVIQLAYALK
jgi:hypothetical protein